MEATEDWEDEENDTEEGNDEEVDLYRTKYIDWEAKEVIDLISSSDESGWIWVFFELTNLFNVFNEFKTLILAIFVIFDIMDIMNPLYTIYVNWLDDFNGTH